MIIDVHAHIWDDNLTGEKTTGMIHACKRNGIDRLLVSGLIGGYWPTEEQVKLSNESVYKLCEMYPELVRGMIMLNPRHDNCIELIREGLAQKNVVGVKLWVAAMCDDPCVFPIVEEAIKQDVPVLLHAWMKKTGQLDYESTGEHVANLARRYPEAKLILAHLGGNYYHGIKAVRDCPNVWTDNSGTPIECDAIDYSLKNLGSERILYGTDLPGALLNCVAQIEESAATAEEKENMFYKNALRLFGRLK